VHRMVDQGKEARDSRDHRASCSSNGCVSRD
jgi:hypothetical protein